MTPAVTSASLLTLIPGVMVPPNSELYIWGGTRGGTMFVNGYYFDPTP